VARNDNRDRFYQIPYSYSFSPYNIVGLFVLRQGKG
jgi:hypothetical protein